MSARVSVIAACALVLLATACGDDDDPPGSTADGGARDARGPGRDGTIEPLPDGAVPGVDAGPCARDVVPPVLTCPATATIALGAPTPGAAPALMGTDVCDGTIIATAEPAMIARGTTAVAYTASDRAGNTTTCTTMVTALDAFAITALRVVHAELDGTGATHATLAWEPSEGADVTALRVERAPTDAGPWEPVATIDATTNLYTQSPVPMGAWRYRVVSIAGETEGAASASVALHSIAVADYNLRDRPVVSVPFLTNLYGVGRHPTDLTRGPYPFVLLMHGNHGNCRGFDPEEDDACAESTTHECSEGGFTTTPNAEGLLYLAETLAAQGIIAVTVSANALNCRDDFILERAHLVLAHLAQWRVWATAGGEPFGSRFAGVADMRRVGLVGHSRGGEAVAHVPSVLSDLPGGGVSVTSIFAIAPTDYHDPRPAGVPYAVLLPGCDGDVTDLSGMHTYDRSNVVTDPVPRAQVLFPRTNHNFFSRQWLFDDNRRGPLCDPRIELGAEVQQKSLESMLGSWMLSTLSPGGEVEPFVRSDAPTPSGITAWVGVTPDLRWSYASPERLLVANFEEPTAPDGNRLGPNVFTAFGTSMRCANGECGNAFAHQKNGVLLGWDMPMPLASFGLGSVDTTSYPYLSFRIVSRYSRRNTTLTEQDFVLRVRDADGTTVERQLSSVRRVPHLYEASLFYEMLQTVRIPLRDLASASPDLDLHTLSALEMSMGIPGHESGSIVITDIELAR